MFNLFAYLIAIYGLIAFGGLLIWQQDKKDHEKANAKLFLILILMILTCIGIFIKNGIYGGGINIIITLSNFSVLTFLIFNALGDFFLNLDESHHIKGGLAFLIGHISLGIVLFVFHNQPLINIYNVMGFVIYSVFSVIIFTTIYGKIPSKLKKPIMAYLVVLIMMAAITLGCFSSDYFSFYQKITIMLAGALFLISDVLLGLKEFHPKFQNLNRAINLSPFYLSLILYALVPLL